MLRGLLQPAHGTDHQQADRAFISHDLCGRPRAGLGRSVARLPVHFPQGDDTGIRPACAQSDGALDSPETPGNQRNGP